MHVFNDIYHQGMTNAYFYLLVTIMHLMLASRFACSCPMAVDMVTLTAI